MTLQRLYNIAQTGQTADPTAVDNIMAQYQPKKQEGGFWNGFKNFAGSDVGRMLIGGLGTAAAVGLSGGSGKDALRYGLMGAGSTMQSIDSRNRYRDKLMKEQQDRADKLAEAEKSRQHALTVQANTIQANKDAADLEFEREMEKINEGRFYNEQQKANDKQIKIDAINSNPYLSDEQKAWQISQIDIPEFNNDAYYGSMLVRDPNNQEALTYFTNKAKLNSIINPEKLSFTDATKGMYNLSKSDNLPAETKNAIAANYGVSTNFIDTPKKYASGQLGLVQARMDETGEDFATASHNVGIMTPEEKQVLELKKMEREKELDNEYKLGFELFKSELPTQAHREALNEAEARGVPVNVIYQEKYDMAQAELAYKKSQTAKNEADTAGKLTANQFIGAEKQAGINQTLANTDKTRAEIPFIPQKMATDIAHTKSQTAKNMYDINPVQPGTVVNGVTLTGNKAYDTEALKQKAKNESEREKAELNREVAQRRNAEMMPRVMQSIDRAYKALEDGTGLGQFGGWAFTTDKGGQNRADIKNAQAQINTAMRGLLSELGVGATEMNSAAEANAYRYVLAPDMSEGEIKRVLDNFVADYTSGDLKQSLASWVGENGNSDSDLSSISTDDLVGML